jgi:hypothetical protein
MSCGVPDYINEDRYAMLVADQGAAFSYQVAFQDEDGVVTDLTAFDARMQVRASHDASLVVLEFTTLNGRITIDEPNGLLYLNADTATMDGIDAGSYVYDLEMVLPNSEVWRAMEGPFIVTPQVTR